LTGGYINTATAGGGSNQVNSQIDLESVDDKSRVALFVRHPSRINLKDFI